MIGVMDNKLGGSSLSYVVDSYLRWIVNNAVEMIMLLYECHVG